MEFFKVLLILSNVFYFYADNVSIKYKKFLGTTDKGGTALVECAGNVGETSVGFAFNITSSSCTGLSLSWLEDKQTVEEHIYMLKIRSNEEYDPPKIFYRNSDADKKHYYRYIPVELKYGSQLDLYISSSSATTGYIIVLRSQGDYLLKAAVSYGQSTLECSAKYNGIWSLYRELISVQFTANKVEKLSFRTASTGFEIYHDDQWLVDYSDSSSPRSSLDFNYLTIWVIEGSQVNLHRVDFTQ